MNILIFFFVYYIKLDLKILKRNLFQNIQTKIYIDINDL